MAERSHRSRRGTVAGAVAGAAHRGGRASTGGGPGAPVRRGPVVVGIAAVLLAGGLADRAAGAAGSSAPVPPAGVASPAAALSSSWFCAGASAPGGEAAGSLVIANDSGAAETATVTLVPDVGHRITSSTTVGPRAVVDVPEQVGRSAHWVGAEVDLDGGRSAVEQVVRGPQGASGTPCATSGAASWWFAGGATLVNASDVLTLFNPYDSDAIVDLSFTTNEGGEVPGDFQGLDVPARSIVAVDLGSHLRRRTQISTTVHARTGRIVAFSTTDTTPPFRGEALLGAPSDPSNPTASDPAAPAAGLAVTLGASSTSTSIAWPDGITGGGLDERYVIYNPGASTADLTLSVALDQGQAEPFALQLGPGQVSTIDANGEARIPPGVGHSATLRSLDGVGVVAVRLLTGVSPAARRGSGALMGESLAAPSWLVPVATSGGAAADLTVLSTSSVPLDVTVDALRDGAEVPLPGLDDLTMAPGQRMILPLPRAGASGRAQASGDPIGSVVVHASGPVYVESDQYAGSPPTIWLSPGVPLS